MAPVIEPASGDPESTIVLAMAHVLLGSISSYWHVELQPSPPTLLPSSHCSPALMVLLPHNVQAPTEHTPGEPLSVHMVPSVALGLLHIPVIVLQVPTEWH